MARAREIKEQLIKAKKIDRDGESSGYSQVPVASRVAVLGVWEGIERDPRRRG